MWTMRVFKMNGYQITGPRRFCEEFSPADYLRDIEMAAGFARHQLRPLSAWSKYNSELLFQTVFLKAGAFILPPESPMDYFGADGPRAALSERERAAVDGLKAYGPAQDLLSEVWGLAMETRLPPDERLRLFVLLAAGYFLSGRTPLSRPIGPREAERAYLRSETEPAAPARWIEPGPASELRLSARPEPYRLVLDPGAAAQRLAAGSVIGLCRLTAVPHRQGSAALPVKLELCRGRDDPAPETVSFFPGDYRYLSVVDGRAACLHPVTVANGLCTMSRRGDTLLLETRDGPPAAFSCAGTDIVSFAPEERGQGWVLLSAAGLDLSHYSRLRMYESRLAVLRRIVQVRMDGSILLLLDESGRVTSNIRHTEGLSGLASL